MEAAEDSLNTSKLTLIAYREIGKPKVPYVYQTMKDCFVFCNNSKQSLLAWKDLQLVGEIEGDREFIETSL